MKPQKARKKDAQAAEFKADAEHLFARHKEKINRHVKSVPYAEVTRARKDGWTLEQLEIVQDHFAADYWWMDNCGHKHAGFPFEKPKRIEDLFGLKPRVRPTEATNGSHQRNAAQQKQRALDPAEQAILDRFAAHD